MDKESQHIPNYILHIRHYNSDVISYISYIVNDTYYILSTPTEKPMSSCNKNIKVYTHTYFFVSHQCSPCINFKFSSCEYKLLRIEHNRQVFELRQPLTPLLNEVVRTYVYIFCTVVIKHF